MDLNAIIAEFNRRKAQAQRGISDLFQPSQKPSNYTQNLTDMLFKPQGYEMASGDELKAYAAQVAKEYAQNIVPAPIGARSEASRTDPSAASRPFSTEEIRQMTPYVTAAAPITYHGSPHTFDKFDASKIGTGEGAQTYGHGLYFAENPQTAKSYQAGFTRRDPGRLQYNGVKVDPESLYGRSLETIAITKNKQFALQNIDDQIRFNETYAPSMADSYKNLRKLIEEVDPTNISLKEGNMYRVNIPDEHAAKMLDWDKPLSEQSLPKQFLDEITYQLNKPASEITGEQAYKVLANRRGKGGAEALSAELQKAGIPGIKYLDQGSRPGMQVQQTGNLWAVSSKDSGEIIAGGFPSKEAAQASKEFQGTRNFVVFDPAILKDVSRQ